MDQCENCGTILPKVRNFTNHEKSGKINAPVQCQARFNLNFEENFLYILSVWPFYGLFLALFSFSLKFSSGNLSSTVDKMVGIFTKRIWQPYNLDRGFGSTRRQSNPAKLILNQNIKILRN